MPKRKLPVLAASLWDLRAQCEQKLRILTHTQRLLEQYTSDGPSDAGKRSLTAALDEIVRIDTFALDMARDCRAMAVLLPTTEADA